MLRFFVAGIESRGTVGDALRRMLCPPSCVPEPPPHPEPYPAAPTSSRAPSKR
jgi:hypothetical protein